MSRSASLERSTKETRIKLSISLDGSGRAELATGVPFLDHMLTLFTRHGYFDLEIKATGDLEVDQHHTIEDLGIVMGAAIKEALGDKQGIRRFGFFILPMDEALVRVALDLSGRPCLVYNVPAPVDHISGIDVRVFQEFFQALNNSLGASLHIDLIRGDDVHHILEAVFKAFAKALDRAIQPESRETGVPSTKGTLA